MASRRVLWHELGHAAYAAHLDSRLPWSLAAPPARCLDEGVAELIADVAETDACLADDLGLSRDEASRLGVERRAARLSWQRWQLARAAFERDAYRAPDADLALRWRELVLEYVGAVESAPWTAMQHLCNDPGSQIDYLFADCIRRELAGRLGLCHRLGMPGEAGVFLRERVFRFGASRGWRELLGSLDGWHAV
jgi:hypothetical protein